MLFGRLYGCKSRFPKHWAGVAHGYGFEPWECAQTLRQVTLRRNDSHLTRPVWNISMSPAESPAHTQSDGATPRVSCTYIAAAPVRCPREVGSLDRGWSGMMKGMMLGGYLQPFPAAAGNTVKNVTLQCPHPQSATFTWGRHNTHGCGPWSV